MSYPEKLKLHIERVCTLCKIFADELALSAEETNILLCAAELHDIEKPSEKKGLVKNHTIAGAERIISESLAPNKERVADVVRWHRGKFNPDSLNWKMAAILRLSDKLDKFDKGQSGAETKCTKSMGKIEKWCEDNGYARDTAFLALKDTFDKLLSQKLGE